MRIARLALFSILLGTGASDSTLSGTQGRDDLSPALLDRPVCPHIGSRLEISGDQIERVVSWTEASDISSLAGLPVRLRLVMKDADLYTLRFR